MRSHHNVAKFTSHEHIEKWNPFLHWAEKLLGKEETAATAVTVLTILLYVNLFCALSHAMENRTIAGF